MTYSPPYKRNCRFYQIEIPKIIVIYQIAIILNECTPYFRTERLKFMFLIIPLFLRIWVDTRRAWYMVNNEYSAL